MWHIGSSVNILTEPVLIIFQCSIINRLQEPVHISSILQNDSSFFLHVSNVLTADISKF